MSFNSVRMLPHAYFPVGDVLGIVDFLPKRGQATVGLLSPYPECDWNQGYHLVSPHLDAGQGKVVRPG